MTNLILGPTLARLAPQFFWLILPLLLVRHCSKLSSYAIERIINESNLRKWQKITLGPILTRLPKIWAPQFFFISSTSSSSQCSRLSSQSIQRNTNSPNMRKLEKPNFQSDFSPFGPNLGSKNFLTQIYLYVQLEIVPSYHHMQFKGKLINQT